MLTSEFTQKDSLLADSQSGPKTDKVAMLSTTFQNWSRLRILCALSSLILTHDRLYAFIPGGPMATLRHSED
jgi:hypothetical protein